MPTETPPEIQTQIKHVAFEAAYLEMVSPDPASHRFARRVAEHEERLRQEQAERVDRSHRRNRYPCWMGEQHAEPALGSGSRLVAYALRRSSYNTEAG